MNNFFHSKDAILTKMADSGGGCSFQGEKLMGVTPKLAYCGALTQSVVSALEARFMGDEDFMRACCIFNVKTWPSSRESNSGKTSIKLVLGWLLDHFCSASGWFTLVCDCFPVSLVLTLLEWVCYLSVLFILILLHQHYVQIVAPIFENR